MKKLAIITVNYNNKQDTVEFLESLKKLDTKGFETNIIVVDNGSTDGSVSAIQKKFKNISLLQTGENKGFTGGYNNGLQYSIAWGADYCFIINNDTLISDTLLVKKLVETIESKRNIGVVTPKILFAPGFEFYQERYEKDEQGNVIWYAGGIFDWANVMSKHRGIDEVDQGQYNNIEEVDYVSGCCLLMKREVFEKIGFFDEKLFSYFEDADFMMRLKAIGLVKYYDGRASLYHKVSRTTGIGSPHSDYLLTRNRLYFGMRYANARTQFALIREGFKFLLLGRPMQRKGVIDFLLGNFGPPPPTLNWKPGNIEYPFKLSVVIVNYNTADLTKGLLKSIFDKKSGINQQSTEIILLDNGRLDPSDKFIKQFPNVKYLQNRENTGFSGGYNKTIRYSSGEYILLLNSDIEILPNALSNLVVCAEKFKGEAVIGGKLVFPDKSQQDSCFNLPTLTGAFKEYFLGKKGSYFMFEPPQDRPTRVEGLIMACFLIPRKILNRLGYLDEGTFVFFEDIEYCRRLKKGGVPIYYCPGAQFIHYGGASHKKLDITKREEYMQKGALHYHGKFYFTLLTIILRLGQKLGRVRTPKPSYEEGH